MENSAYWLYMAEEEGYLDTHYSKVSALIKDIEKRATRGETELTLNNTYLCQFGLSLDELTDKDYRRIAKIAHRVP